MNARRTGIASVTALFALTLTAGVVHAVAPDWSRRMGIDVWNIAEAEEEARDATSEAHDLHRHGEVVTRQIETSNHITHDLATGQMTLAVAVDELVRLNSSRIGFLASMRCAYGAVAADAELIAWYAVRKVERELDNNPSRRAVVMARLKDEFRSLTGKAWTRAD